MRMFLKAMAATWSAVIVVACGNGSGDDDLLGLNTISDGVLTLEIGDAPVDNLDQVNITITAIEFGGDQGSTSDEAVDIVELDSPTTINLLEFQNGEFYNLLDSVDVQEGDYEWIRFRLDYDDNPPNVVEKTSFAVKDLEIPSGEQTGLKLHGGENLVINGGDDHHYAIDIDLHRSLIQTGSGTYKLKPSYRLIDLGSDTFSISGEINLSRPIGCNGAIYAYKGNVTPDDIENPDDGETVSGTDSSDSVEPFIVTVIGSSTTYTVNNLTTGTYTLAFTCDVEDDALDEDNDATVDFLGEATVTNLTTDRTNVDIPSD